MKKTQNNNVEAAVMKIDAMPDFFVGDMCIINKLVGDMHQKTDGIANSGKQTGLVNKYMTSHEEWSIYSDTYLYGRLTSETSLNSASMKIIILWLLRYPEYTKQILY